jgi:hypothetical protein
MAQLHSYRVEFWDLRILQLCAAAGLCDAGELANVFLCARNKIPGVRHLDPDLAARGLRRSLSALGMSPHWWCWEFGSCARSASPEWSHSIHSACCLVALPLCIHHSDRDLHFATARG